MSASVDLLYSDVEDELRASVRSLLGDRSDPADVLARCERDEPHDAGLWDALTQMGVAGLPVSEEDGGAGASWRESAVVAEELGRFVAPVPFLTSAVMSAQALMTCGDGDTLRAVASGETTAAMAVPLSTPALVHLTPSVRATQDHLDGSVTSVAGAAGCDVLLVPAADGDAMSLFAVDATAVDREPVVSMDLTRPVHHLRFDRTPARRVASGDTADDAMRSALRAGAVILASEQLGVAEWCLETTIAHVKGRYQFGRPIGSFQALKHRLADVWVSVTQARAAARYAAACLAQDDDDLDIALAVAQAHCSTVAVRASEECIQMHGGIGFTWEHPAHLFLKRAKTTSVALGTPAHFRSQLAGLLELVA